MEAALASGKEELVDALTREGITKEEQMDLLTPFVKPKEVAKYKGSKTSNPAGMTGVGTSLIFTDSNVWNQLKADLGDDATKVNRIFSVDVNDPQEIVMSNGYEDVKVKMLILGESVDKEPSRLSEKEDEE